MAAGIIVAGGIGIGLISLIWIVPNTSYTTAIGFTPPQPVPFSHQHHVGGLGIDCRYCHTSVEISSNAGMPATQICMTCHSQIWTNASVLQPVRQSLAQQVPLRWNRVYALPDYVYFDHSIHVAKGVGCSECHGDVADMPLTKKVTSLYMSWCLDCHRNPAPHLRPRDAVFDTDWHRTADTPSGEQLMTLYRIHPARLSDCSVCHR
jgi:hypothetical protein